MHFRLSLNKNNIKIVVALMMLVDDDDADGGDMVAYLQFIQYIGICAQIRLGTDQHQRCLCFGKLWRPFSFDGMECFWLSHRKA